MVTNDTFLKKKLDFLQIKGLRRNLRSMESSQNRKIIVEGEEVLSFCSNNYLGLADDIRLQEVAFNCIASEGIGSGASRLVCGNMEAHRKLEKKIAEFKGTQDCLLFSTGYMANIGIISSLFDRKDVVFADKLNHASILDGIILSRATLKRYPHKNMDALENMIKESQGYKRRVIITDSVFSMDGDIAPLHDIVELARRYDCLVMVDEAHAFGVLGREGKGAVEHFSLEEKIDIQMGTLSKAVGVFGAYCCGSKLMKSFLVNHARSFIYTTGMPPFVAAAAFKAIEIIEKEPSLRQRLWDNTEYVMKELKRIGFNTMDSETPIIPLLVRAPETAVEFSKRLFKEGIFVQAIRPPTVPNNTARLRLTIIATHTREDLDSLLYNLEKIGKELCLI